MISQRWASGHGARRWAAAATLGGALAAIVLVIWPATPTKAEVALMSHAAATTQLAAAGIPWTSSGNCSDRYNPECTSFEEIRQTTIDGIITLKTASGCPIMITGGTETGHGTGAYTHWNGWKVDISRWDCVGAYIESNFAYLGYISGWGDQYRAPSGNLYTDEGNHWDILYYTCGGCTLTARSPTAPSPTEPSPATPSPTLTSIPGPAASATPTLSAAAPQVAGATRPLRPGPEPEPSGPPIVDPWRIADHRG